MSIDEQIKENVAKVAELFEKSEIRVPFVLVVINSETKQTAGVSNLTKKTRMSVLAQHLVGEIDEINS